MTSKVRSLPLDDFRRSARLALLLAVLLAMLSLIVQAALVQPARAQSVEDQLQRMQRELSDLQRQVYTNGTPPAAASGGASGGGGGVTPTQAARIQLQLDQFESQMAELTGRIEDMNFRIQSVTDRLDKLVADVDLRLRNLEQGGLPPVGAADDGAAKAGDSGQMATAPAASGAAPSSAPRPGTIGSISENDLNSFQQQGAQQQGAQQQGAQQQGAQQQGAQQQGAEQQGSSTTAPTAQQSAAAPAAAALPGGSPQEQYDYAFGLLRQANYAGAEQAFSAFLAEHPQNALAGNAKYWLGETYYVRGNYQQAAVTFAEGFEAYPNNSKAPDNLLKLGMSLASLGSTQDACGTFTVLLDRYADAPATILSRAQRESQRLGCQ
jgi:tol-pal system protein YbgF